MRITPVSNTSFGKLIIKNDRHHDTFRALRALAENDKEEILPVMNDTFEKLDKNLNGRDVVLSGDILNGEVNICLFDAKTEECISRFAIDSCARFNDTKTIIKKIKKLYTNFYPPLDTNELIEKYGSTELSEYSYPGYYGSEPRTSVGNDSYGVFRRAMEEKHREEKPSAYWAD